MTRFGTAIAFALLMSLVPGSSASAAIDGTATVEKGATHTWEGEATPATNENYFGQAPSTAALPEDTCTKDLTTYCEQYLVKINNPISDAEKAAGVVKKTAKVKIDIAWDETPVIFDNASVEPTDYDLIVFASDEAGTKGDVVGESAQGDTVSEVTQFNLDTNLTTPAKWLLVYVIYFQVPNANGYTGNVKVT